MPYTTSQILTLTCQIAKVPGYTSLAGQLLNMILQELCQNNDFDFIRKTITINLTAGGQPLVPYPLPSDYLRTREVFYNINGAITMLNQVPLSDYDTYFAGPGQGDYPESFATDISAVPANMYFWPASSVAVPVTVRYQPLMGDIIDPNSIPWFPNQIYLIKRLSGDLMGITDDTRQKQFLDEAQMLLKKFLQMKDDQEGYAIQVKLDARAFKGPGSQTPTKTQPL